MCVIIGKSAEQSKPTEALLRAAWKSNPHGGGIMWRLDKDSPINVNKGLMDIKSFLKYANTIPDNAEAWYHTRIVSRGSMCQEQCHPFYLPDGAWFMHNGTFRIEPWGGMSDTQTVSEYLNDTPELSADVLLLGLCKESYSKVVVMRPGEDVKLFGNWQDYKGYTVSNNYFVSSIEPGRAPTREKVKTWAKARTLCETCELYDVDCYGTLPNYYSSCIFYKKAEDART